eukprot:354234-Chlamydomonas_euryale.AAC.13
MRRAGPTEFNLYNCECKHGTRSTSKHDAPRAKLRTMTLNCGMFWMRLLKRGTTGYAHRSDDAQQARICLKAIFVDGACMAAPQHRCHALTLLKKRAQMRLQPGRVGVTWNHAAPVPVLYLHGVGVPACECAAVLRGLFAPQPHRQLFLARTEQRHRGNRHARTFTLDIMRLLPAYRTRPGAMNEIWVLDFFPSISLTELTLNPPKLMSVVRLYVVGGSLKRLP